MVIKMLVWPVYKGSTSGNLDGSIIGPESWQKYYLQSHVCCSSSFALQIPFNPFLPKKMESRNLLGRLLVQYTVSYTFICNSGKFSHLPSHPANILFKPFFKWYNSVKLLFKMPFVHLYKHEIILSLINLNIFQ